MSVIRQCPRCGGNIVEPAYPGDGAYPSAARLHLSPRPHRLPLGQGVAMTDLTNRRCACAHPDASECVRIRYKPYNGWGDVEDLYCVPTEVCECPCHDEEDSDDDDDGTYLSRRW